METSSAKSAVYAVVDVGGTVCLIVGLLICVLLINEVAEAIDRWADRRREGD